MKAQEIHNMSNDELVTTLANLKEELFNLRFNHATNKLENPNVINVAKKDIARVKTEIRAREIKANA